MKKWQHGYDIETLLELEGKFKRFNKNARGPFDKVAKNTIATLLKDDKLEELDGCIIASFVVKSSGTFNMFRGVPFARKLVGDVVVKAFDWTTKKSILKAFISLAEEARVWVWICIEDASYVDVMRRCGYFYVGSRFSSNGSIFGLYCSDEDALLDSFIRIPMEEKAGLVRVGSGIDVSAAEELLVDYSTPEFTNHYSNYNIGKAWSGISLQGYSPEFSVIEKPAAMSSKWRENNTALRLQETELMEQYPAISDMYLGLFDGCKFDRVRLLALADGGGTLDRHTDQVDHDMGLKDGNLARFHIPVVTNPKVLFSSWDHFGDETVKNMAKGECWYLDIRKPHKAVNNGGAARVHLVFDVYVDDYVRSLL